MKKIKIVAFWDLLIAIIVGVSSLFVALYIILVIKSDTPWYSFEWHYTLIAAYSIALAVTLPFILQHVTIDLNKDDADFFYLVNFRRNDRDIRCNWRIYPSEIENVSVVKLTRQEKKEYTSARFLFSKYLEIEMKYGHKKYVYISHYSNRQIRKITELLLSYKTRQ